MEKDVMYWFSAVGIVGLPLFLLYGSYRLGFYQGKYDECDRWVEANDGPSEQTVQVMQSEINWLRSQLIKQQESDCEN